MSGTTPKNIRDEAQAARWVRDMFGAVAPRYDLLNHVLSLNVDRWWRARTVRQLRHVLDRTDAVVLDVCCGTGDLSIALRQGGAASVIGSDFSHPMLQRAAAKCAMPLFEADALQLPVRDCTADLVTAAFGFRNLSSYERGLAECRRVLKPGGTLALLEFSQPPNQAFRAVYGFYSDRVLPRIGAALSGVADAYTYLPESVVKFPDAERLAAMMSSTGFANVRFERMTFGVVALHTGLRAA